MAMVEGDKLKSLILPMPLAMYALHAKAEECQRSCGTLIWWAESQLRQSWRSDEEQKPKRSWCTICMGRRRRRYVCNWRRR